jgi:hypothetical protein
MGTSALLINTEHANSFLKQLNVNAIETSYDDMIRRNPFLEGSCLLPPQRLRFFNKWQKKQSARQYIYRFTRPIQIQRNIVPIVAMILKKMHLFDIAKSILGKRRQHIV